MARRGEAVYRRVRALNATTGLPVDGGAAQLSLFVAADQSAPVAVTGTITGEGRGYYRVLIPATQNGGWSHQLAGASSTANVVVTGCQWDNQDKTAVIADAVHDEALADHQIAGSAGRALYLAKLVAANPYEATNSGNRIEFKDDGGAIALTATYTDTPDGHERTIS